MHWIANVPDLGAARLTLVDAANLLVRFWNAGDMHYSLLAVGMDLDRFDAVAAMLVRQTETGSPGDNSLLAVREATRTAVPCA